jgi:signal transduction histidine kinase
MQVEQLSELGAAEQMRVDKVVDVLSTLTTRGQDVAEIAHDACNMVTALDLYCDLLQEPGVLAGPFTHYGGELRLVAAASRRLVDKLIAIESPHSPAIGNAAKTHDVHDDPFQAPEEHPHQYQWKNIPAEPIRNLAEELLANRSLLASLAGPTIALTVDVQGGALPVRMSCEDLTRILVNLVKNATEAMSAVGRIHITLWESSGEPENSPWVTLNVEDNGPGLSNKTLDSIFEPRRVQPKPEDISAEWPLRHRGLGLSITRSVVETAGGYIHAANRDPVGACFQIELPVQAS